MNIILDQRTATGSPVQLGTTSAALTALMLLEAAVTGSPIVTPFTGLGDFLPADFDDADFATT